MAIEPTRFILASCHHLRCRDVSTATGADGLDDPFPRTRTGVTEHFGAHRGAFFEEALPFLLPGRFWGNGAPFPSQNRARHMAHSKLRASQQVPLDPLSPEHMQLRGVRVRQISYQFPLAAKVFRAH